MNRLLECIGAIFALCMGIGFAVGAVEKKQGKVGWVKGHKPNGYYEKNVKRPLDFGLALFALIFLWPVMLVTAVLVRMKLGKLILFKQERPGLGGQIFTIRKFRTMRTGEGVDEERLTDFGKKLRSTSIDELPELFNILEGAMSLVGPRPLLVEYLDRYSEEQSYRHDVRPGLTGYAQVLGRNELTWNEKFEDDVKYVNNISFLGDLKIIVRTVEIVLGKKGISSKTSETMEVFTGNG